MISAIFFILLIEIVGSLLLYWLSLIPANWVGGLVGELLRIFIYIFRLGLAYFAGYVAGTRFNLHKPRSVGAIRFYILVMATITTIASISIYYFGFLNYYNVLVNEIVMQDMILPGRSAEQTADVLIEAETGYSPFMGYMVLFANSEALVDMFDETLVIPKSSVSTAVNWILRFLMLVFTWFAARKGVFAGMVEKINSIKENRSMSYDSVFDFMSDRME